MGSPIESHSKIVDLGSDKKEEEEDESFSYAMQLTTSFVLPMALQSANELEAKLSPSQIVAHLPTKNPDAAIMLDRILRMLACHSARLYSLSPVSKHFVRNEDGVSLGPLLALSQDEVFIKSWEYGMHAFEYPDLDPRFNKVFNTAMFIHTTIVMKKILEYSNIKGINFDLPHAIQHAPVYPGVEHIGGDMFESVPKGHTIFMKWILHDWSYEYCLKLLKNCYNAIPNDGKVIVVEAILPTVPENSSSMKSTTHLDLIMMTQNPGGKERTQQEFMALATRTGFSGIRFGCCVSDIWVMEFFK
ncbi:hypothetical protein RGQ29_030722 [Quercus rubra]|uniref:O-methyltransferase C-terminal domain-containing protein n=1 Tax=Quercus rubra TaxID=3512 RepID=A0AAN7EI88_QUERU|nr:hypothetical protein RGQ29_030722 [Quercus rubra]